MSRSKKQKRKEKKRKQKALKKAKANVKRFLEADSLSCLGFKTDSMSKRITNMGIKEKFDNWNSLNIDDINLNGHQINCICDECKLMGYSNVNNPPISNKKKNKKKNKYKTYRFKSGSFSPIGKKKKAKTPAQIEITDPKVLAFIEIKKEYDHSLGYDQDDFIKAVKKNDVIYSIMMGKKDFKAKEKQYGNTFKTIKKDFSSKTPMLNQCFKTENKTPIISNSYLDRKKSKTLRDYKKSNIDELNSSFVSRFVNRFKRSRSIY